MIEDGRPIVIGGTGGSGTRAVAQYCQAHGVFMGCRRNETEDSLPFSKALSANIDTILKETRSLEYSFESLSLPLRSRAIAAFSRAAESHLKGWSGKTRWGFKNPRQIFVLPILATLFPQLTFVHVVRDGRDMAISKNQNQPRQHYSSLFAEPWPETRQSIERFWASTNLAVMRIGVQLFGDNYLLVRIEDLCGPNPFESLRALNRAIGFSTATAVDATRIFQVQSSFGRGAETHRGTITKNMEFDLALKTLGYAC